MANEAAVAEAAPIVAPPDANYDVEDATDPIIAPDENAAPAEAVEKPVEAAPVETKAEKVLRLKELRKKDSDEFDEDLLEKIAGEHQVARTVLERQQELYATDPVFRKAYLKAIVAKGYKPTPAEQAEIEDKPAEKVADPKAPQRYAPEVVRNWVNAECEKMEAAGHPMSKILAWREGAIETWITKPQREDEQAAAAAEKSAERQRNEQAAAQAKVQADATALRTSAAKAAKKEVYGDLWVKDSSQAMGFRCKDAAVMAEVKKLYNAGYDDVVEMTTMALAKLKRLVTGTSTPKPPAVRPVIQNQKVAQKAKVDPKYDIEE